MGRRERHNVRLGDNSVALSTSPFFSYSLDILRSDTHTTHTQTHSHWRGKTRKTNARVLSFAILSQNRSMWVSVRKLSRQWLNAKLKLNAITIVLKVERWGDSGWML